MATHQESSIVLSLEGVCVSFRSAGSPGFIRVLRDVSLAVRQGQFVAVLGPSGCGKSTMLRVMSGLVDADEGCVVTRASGNAGPLQTAFNFQKPVLLPWLTVEENALLPFRLSPGSAARQAREAEERLQLLLDVTGLARFRHALPHELSGGMQMRAALVRTMIASPELIFMDEPFSAIDELSRYELGRELRHMLSASGAATVFVTHSIQEAALLADRIVIMSPRPARIIDDFVVPYRDAARDDALLRSPDFLDVCARLREVAAHE